LRWLLLASLFLATRLLTLTRLPIFFDETLHARWALLVAEGTRPWWKSWEWGRVLTIWMGALVSPFASDLLWANRLVSVAGGAVALAATVAIGRRLFGAQAGFLAGLLYVVCPFTLLYDRLALADSWLTALAALTLLFSLRAADAGAGLGRRLADGALTGAAMALAVLAKAPGLLLFAIPALVAVAGGFRREAWAPLAAAYAVGAPPTAYALWRFFTTANTALMADIATQTQADRLAHLGGNLALAGSWLWTLWTPPLVVVGLAGAAFGARRRPREVALLLALSLLPALAFGATLGRWLPRYLLWASVPFLVLAAWGLERAAGGAQRWLARLAAAPRAALATAALAAVLGPALANSYRLIIDPPRATLPHVERDQLILGWTSGYGIRDTETLVREELERHPEGVRVVVHVNRFRTLRATPLALGLAFAREPRVRMEDWNLDHPSARPALEAWAAEGPTLLVVPLVDAASPPPSPLHWGHLATFLQQTRKPDGRPCDDVYRLCAGARCGGA
jgi:4-amino-4-deoxy-L-arabinose transferase-like glycosyltransferase